MKNGIYSWVISNVILLFFRYSLTHLSSIYIASTIILVGQESRDGKVALYHCNYCNKDLSGRIRMKCVACPDFDLCVECFSVGAELTPHKSNHPYRVMVSVLLPL